MCVCVCLYLQYSLQFCYEAQSLLVPSLPQPGAVCAVEPIPSQKILSIKINDKYNYTNTIMASSLIYWNILEYVIQYVQGMS